MIADCGLRIAECPGRDGMAGRGRVSHDLAAVRSGGNRNGSHNPRSALLPPLRGSLLSGLGFRGFPDGHPRLNTAGPSGLRDAADADDARNVNPPFGKLRAPSQVEGQSEIRNPQYAATNRFATIHREEVREQ